MIFRHFPRGAVVFLLICGVVACKEGETSVRVASLSFTGVNAVTEAQLKSVLSTVASSRLPWGEKQYFSREQFEADLKRIKAFYNDRGFPDARVASFDASLSEDQSSVKVTVNIEEGEPVRVERIDLVGFGPLPDEHESALPARLALQPGQPLDRALVQATREAALDELKERGFPYASVQVSEAAGSSEKQHVVTLTATPGALAYFGPIEISGNQSVSDRVVRRQMTFRPGQPFQQSRIRESQRKLYGLELFNFANVEATGADAKPTEIPIRVTLTEGKQRKVNFGLGYGSEEKARGEIDWRNVNFLGAARTAGAFARYSSLDRGVRLNLKQPYLFNPRYSAEISAQSWFADELAYDLETIGGRLTLTREFGRLQRTATGRRQSTTVALTYANEFEEFGVSDEALNDPTFRDELIALGLDPDTGEGRGQLSSLMIDAARNTTDNPIDATRGYSANVHLEKAGEWLKGDYDFYEFSAEGRAYFSAGRAVVALRARTGSIGSAGNDDAQTALVPFHKRYFLGGATNMRGWGRFEVSPLSDGGLPIGGSSFASFTTELRVPIAKNFGAVLFVDGGNVWTDALDFNLDDMRYSAGPGLRYNTPIGPIRLDLGYQLNPIPNLLINGELQQRRYRIHFSIGQAF